MAYPSMSRVALYCFAFFVFLGLSPKLAHSQTVVYLKPEEALKIIFKDSKEVIKETKTVSAELNATAKKGLGYSLPKEKYDFFIGRTEGKIDGYAVIDDQVGKVMPITFITRIDPDGKVSSVEIMVYRESHGGEVTSRRFLNQFKQKTLNDELRLHGSIVNITGATLSSQALVVGVKRDLFLWNAFYGKL